MLGTKNGDAAIVERMSEEGATLLKNNSGGLPLDASSLNNGDILVTGANANHLVADPTNEASTGMIDRDAVNPLQQLKEFSGKPGAFTFAPANDPTGYPVPLARAVAGSNSAVTGNLARTGPGAGNDSSLDFTTASPQGQLAPGSYSWTGYIYVPEGRHVHVRVPAEREHRRRQRDGRASTARPARHWPTRPSSTAPPRRARPPTRATPSRC